MPTAFESELKSRYTPSLASTPTRVELPFQDTRTLSPANTVNAQLQAMNPRAAAWKKNLQERAFGGNRLAKDQYFQRELIRNEAGLDAELAQQAQQQVRVPGSPAPVSPGAREHRNFVHVDNILGPSMDQDVASNWRDYSPAVQAAMKEGKTAIDRELSALFSGMDKNRWASEEDAVMAINQLPSVQRFGGMLDGYITSAARRFMSPELKAQFEAKDATVKSFATWFRQKGYATGESARDAFEVFTADDANALAIKDAFENDANAKKFDAVGTTIQPRAITPDQQMEVAGRADTARMKRDREAAEQNLAIIKTKNPRLAERMYVSAQGTLETLDAGERDPAQLDADIAEINRVYEESGTQKRAVKVPDMAGGYKVETVAFQPKSAYANIGNESWKRKTADQQEAIIATIATNEALAQEKVIDPSSAAGRSVAQARAEAAAARNIYGLVGARLFDTAAPAAGAAPPPASPPASGAVALTPERRADAVAKATAKLNDPNPAEREKAKMILSKLGVSSAPAAPAGGATGPVRAAQPAATPAASPGATAPAAPAVQPSPAAATVQPAPAAPTPAVSPSIDTSWLKDQSAWDYSVSQLPESVKQHVAAALDTGLNVRPAWRIAPDADKLVGEFIAAETAMRAAREKQAAEYLRERGVAMPPTMVFNGPEKKSLDKARARLNNVVIPAK